MAVSKAGKNHIYLHRQQHIKVVNFFQRIQENRQYHQTRVRINREKKQRFSLVYRLVTRCLWYPKLSFVLTLTLPFNMEGPIKEKKIQIQLVLFNNAHLLIVKYFADLELLDGNH